MKNNNRKYYTLKGLDELYEEYKDADIYAKKKGYKNKYPLGFESMEEAEIFRSGEWNEHFQKVSRSYETKADAVVYTDGSYDSKKKYATYGLVIFFRTGEIYVESAKLEDDDNEKKYIIQRYDLKNNKQVEYGKENKNNNIIKTAYQYSGECLGVMRSLEICCKEKKIKDIDLVYDCEAIIPSCLKERKEGKQSSDSDMAKIYNDFFEELLNEVGLKFNPIKVDSHNSKNNIDTVEFSHAVYNDLVDVLAKAETTEIPLKRSENFNLVRALPECDFNTFNEVNARSVEQRREHARDIYKKIVERVSPIFV